jgi:hypothetical protein
MESMTLETAKNSENKSFVHIYATGQCVRERSTTSTRVTSFVSHDQCRFLGLLFLFLAEVAIIDRKMYKKWLSNL